MSRIRTLFLGTAHFSAQILERILNDEHLEMVGVVTQPDRPRGRNMKILPTQVKEVALKHNLPCLTPENINNEASLLALKQMQAELAIVVAYGQILSDDFLQLFHYGAVNVHGSLLPRWRGAAPIQRSIEAGETVTGVTLQKIVRELDAGDIIGTRTLTVDAEMNALDVLNAFIPLSVDLLTIDLMDYVRGNLAPIPQDHSQATYAPKIKKEECQINWHWSARDIHNKIRAFIMGPGAFTFWQSQRLKLLRSRLINVTTDTATQRQPGDFWLEQGRLLVQCGSNSVLELVTVLPENRSEQSGTQWWQSIKTGSSVTLPYTFSMRGERV